MTTYQSKLVYLVAKLTPLTVEERIEFCTEIGLQYAWLLEEISREIYIDLDM